MLFKMMIWMLCTSRTSKMAFRATCMNMRNLRCFWNFFLSKWKKSPMKLRTSRWIPFAHFIFSRKPHRPEQANVQSTQEIVELILDSNRNALLALDLKVSDFVLHE